MNFAIEVDDRLGDCMNRWQCERCEENAKVGAGDDRWLISAVKS